MRNPVYEAGGAGFDSRGPHTLSVVELHGGHSVQARLYLCAGVEPNVGGRSNHCRRGRHPQEGAVSSMGRAGDF